MAWTEPITWVPLIVVSANNLNEQIRDNTSYLKEEIDALKSTINNLVGLLFKWKPTTSDSLSIPNRTSSVAWTNLDLTSVTSEAAEWVILLLSLVADSVGAGGYALLGVRKDGETPTDYPFIVLSEALGHTGGVTSTQCAVVPCAMAAGQVIEYQLYITGTIQVDAKIKVLGYIEKGV
ncbi:MAG TPA: hypothetical protein VMW60_01805 [Dehalococcoidales bacterium]|nr:hypothetical protein [Dehalococcoidales bacterium]